jgi:NRPS condensation-like uncharacterized protein
MSKEIEILKIYPLAPMQSAMLYQFWLDSESTAYLSQIVCSLTGEIDIVLFERSLNILIKKYDVLRTIFLYEDLEEPVQVVLKERATGIHFIDITHKSQEEKEKYLERFQENQEKIRFDLTKDLLIRASLIKTGLKSYRLVWSLHHILVDGWSLGIIFKDLIRIYISLKRGESIESWTVQHYSDYVDWLGKQDKEKGMRLWKKYLEGYEQDALMGRYRKQVKNGDSKYEFAQYCFSIDEASTKGIMEVARTKQTTLSTVFRTIWGILLQRFNNTNDVVFGAVVSGRPPEIPGIENLVGLFINTIPVRIRVDEKIKRFSQLLNEVHKNSALLKFYEYLPLSEIQANSSLKHQLIDHTMMFQNFPVQEELIEKHLEKIAGFKLENYRISEHAHYEFDISIGPGKAISVLFRFNSNVYERELMKKIALHFKSVTKQVAANPDLEIKEIELPVGKEVMNLKKARMNVKFNI